LHLFLNALLDRGMSDRRAGGGPSSSTWELRKLWDEGKRGQAIRRALTDPTHRGASDGDLRWLAETLRCYGLRPAALALQVEIARRKGPNADDWMPLIRRIHKSGDPWWAFALIEETGLASRDARALRIEIALALGDDIGGFVSQWLEQFHDEEALESAVRWWVAGGHIREAEELLGRCPGLDLWRARIAVWRRQPDIAREALKQVDPSPHRRCLEAVIALQDGDAQAAEAMFRSLATADESPGVVRAEAWSWLATLLRESGRFEDVPRAVDAANSYSKEFTLAPRLERRLATEAQLGRQQRADSRSGRDRLAPRDSFFSRLRGRVRALDPVQTIADFESPHLLYPLGVKASDPMIEGLESALERLGGNRTPYPTIVENGNLVAVRLPMDPRQHGATIQRVLWTRGVDAVRQLFREFAPDIGANPLSRIYLGEIELWVGNYTTAEAIFRAILAEQRHTLWAWIGLGASVMFQGDHQHALEIWREGVDEMKFEGPTLFVYRGECHRRLGMREPARDDLETAIREKPQRLSARINLALLDRDADAMAEAERACADFAPILMEELQGTAAERLEQVLEAMGGNRSSSAENATYHLWGQLWGCPR
jgi:tetratricopeptide (TPR) repeat protein